MNWIVKQPVMQDVKKKRNQGEVGIQVWSSNLLLLCFLYIKKDDRSIVFEGIEGNAWIFRRLIRLCDRCQTRSYLHIRGMKGNDLKGALTMVAHLYGHNFLAVD